MSSETTPLIVGVGASAGGLEAMTGVFSPAQPRSDLAFVVVQHLSPDYKSMIVDLLAKQTSLAVKPAKQGERVEGGTVYVIEPQTILTISAGRIQAAPQERGKQTLLPIDAFLQSLAEDQGANAVAVILSGTGTDGTRGARAVKEVGGLVIAQSEDSAAFDGMPRSVRVSGLADLVLPPGEIAGELARVLDEGARGRDGLDNDPHQVVVNRILSTLRKEACIDFGHYKTSTLVRRIQRRLGVLSLSPLQYAERFSGDPNEQRMLVNDMLIGVTRFFRDGDAFALLTEQLTAYVRSHSDDPVRVWVAGCSTGEEAYSIAITVSEVLKREAPARSMKLFATDINGESLRTAASSGYSHSAVADIPGEYLSEYFEQSSAGNYIARQFLRDRMLFSRHNVVQDAPFSGLDVVVCRNLLIYLRSTVQARVCQNFAFALKKGGILMLGPSESPPDEQRDFDLVDARWQLYRATGRGARSTPSMLHAAVRAPATSASQVHARRDLDLLEVYSSLVPLYCPSFAVVDRSFQLVHRTGDLGGLLRVPEGRATLDLRQMLPDAARGAVASAVRQLKTQDAVRVKGLMAERGDKQFHFDLLARKTGQSMSRSLTLLVFEGLAEQTAEPVEVIASSSGADTEERIRELEELLTASNATLKSTVEELESANEELQATNEELLSSNEELQSLNEELQSVNEELHTVNSEFQTKIEELSRLNSDMDQLLSSIDIGALFVDENLRIRRFNAPAARFVNLLEQDVGRPLGHLSHEFGDVPLIEMCSKALSGNETVEQLLATTSGFRVLFRARGLPKEMPDGGLVLTFTDVTSVHLERESRHLLDEALQRTDVPIALLDLEGQITLANRAFASQFGRDPKWLAGLDVVTVLSAEEHENFTLRLKEAVKGESWYGLAHSLKADGTLFQEAIRLAPLRNEEGQPVGVLRLTERVYELGAIEGASVTGTYTWDIRTDETLCSLSLYDVLGLERFGPPPTMEVVYPLILEEDRRGVDENLAKGLDSWAPYEFSFRARRPSGGVQRLAVRMLPDRLPTGELRRVIGVMWVVHEANRAAVSISAAS